MNRLIAHHQTMLFPGYKSYRVSCDLAKFTGRADEMKKCFYSVTPEEAKEYFDYCYEADEWPQVEHNHFSTPFVEAFSGEAP